MMLAEKFEERLKWLDPNHYELRSDVIVVEEKEKGGEAKITFDISNDVIKMNLSKDNRIRYLRQQKVADAVLLEFSKPHVVKLHIVELKLTVNKKEWEKIKAQFEGALLNALAVLGILGLSDFQDVAFYTVYKNDELSVEENPNSTTLKTGVGKPLRPVSSDWENDFVSILSIKDAHHRKILLDDNREARIAL